MQPPHVEGKSGGEAGLDVAELTAHNRELIERLEKAEQALQAMRTGAAAAPAHSAASGARVSPVPAPDTTGPMLAQAMYEGLASLHPDGRIRYCNPRLAEMLATAPNALFDVPFQRYLPMEERAAFTALCQESAARGHARADLALLRPDSTTLPVLVSASAAHHGGQAGLCLVIVDQSEQAQARARRKELRQRLAEQSEQERARIARELHDGPLQELIGLSYALQAMSAAAPQDADEFQRIRETILAISRNLRGVCNDLRPPHTIRFGLSKAIFYQAEETRARHPELAIELSLDKDDHVISKAINAILFRIYQECLNNVLQHANAHHVWVRLALNEKQVVLEVQDDGDGFEMSDWVELARQGRLGLVGMRERAESAGGRVWVKSQPGQGATVHVEMPLTPIA